jgi:hypothetical protein
MEGMGKIIHFQRGITDRQNGAFSMTKEGKGVAQQVKLGIKAVVSL